MTNTEAIEQLRYLKHGVKAESEQDKALDLAISALERERWHDADERIPDVENVIGWYGGGKYDQLRWLDLVDGTVYEGERLIAWYQLPEPPKEET